LQLDGGEQSYSQFSHFIPSEQVQDTHWTRNRWAQNLVWKFWRTEKSLYFPQIRTSPIQIQHTPFLSWGIQLNLHLIFLTQSLLSFAVKFIWSHHLSVKIPPFQNVTDCQQFVPWASYLGNARFSYCQIILTEVHSILQSLSKKNSKLATTLLIYYT
jgi:hypothetical protein